MLSSKSDRNSPFRRERHTFHGSFQVSVTRGIFINSAFFHFQPFICQNKLAQLLRCFGAADVAWLTLVFLSLLKKLKSVVQRTLLLCCVEMLLKGGKFNHCVCCLGRRRKRSVC